MPTTRTTSAEPEVPLPSALPFVSIVVPCRNEVGFIGTCLDSILASEYPPDRLEVLVVDGLSEDGTRPIVERYAARDGRVRLLDNPAQTTPAALNVGIRAARGDRLVRMDAHASYPPAYLPRLIAWQDRTGADNVGGVWVTLPGDGSSIARAIAIGLAHPFGVGNAYFRVGAREPRWVDTVPFGCYRREIFARIGGFDEELLRNQDDEFNLRLVARGGRILLVPEIVSYYHARASLAKLWRTYEQYGYFKPLVVRKLGRILTVRQVVPVAFVTALLGSAALAPWSGVMRALAIGIGGAYTAAVVGHAVALGHAEGPRGVLALCVVFPVIHLSYALGWLRGIVNFLLLRRNPIGAAQALPQNR